MTVDDALVVVVMAEVIEVVNGCNGGADGGGGGIGGGGSVGGGGGGYNGGGSYNGCNGGATYW
jgi:hypothetical protein